MVGLDPLMAAVNDVQSLNSRQVATLLIDTVRESESKTVRASDILSQINQISAEKGPRSEIANNVLEEIDGADFSAYGEYLTELNNRNIGFNHVFTSGYPEKLWDIDDLPLGLYTDGNSNLSGDNLAIVGTRRATDERISDTQMISKRLSKQGYTIVSGLARGVDAAAHRGAVEAGGTTLAVLPGDVETIRPKSNSGLTADIRKNGALISEVSKFTKMHNGRYIERNRITSGLSDAVIITASGESGGTVRQAELAESQDIPRFLYNPDDGAGQSPEILRKMGFKSFSSAEELVDLLSRREEIFNTRTSKPSTLNEFCSG